MTLEKLAAMIAENFDFMREEIRREFREELGGRIDELRQHMDAKFLAVHNRIDDVVDTRAKRVDLDATKARVTRIEGHLGLA